MRKRTILTIAVLAGGLYMLRRMHKKLEANIGAQQDAKAAATRAVASAVNGFGDDDMLLPHPGAMIYKGAGPTDTLGSYDLTDSAGRSRSTVPRVAARQPLVMGDMTLPGYRRQIINDFVPLEGTLYGDDLAGFGKSFKKFMKKAHQKSIVGKIVKKVAPKSVKKVLAKIDPSRHTQKPVPAPSSPDEVVEYQDANGKAITKEEYDRIVADMERQAAAEEAAKQAAAQAASAPPQPGPVIAPPPPPTAFTPPGHMRRREGGRRMRKTSEASAASEGAPPSPIAVTSVETSAPTVLPPAPVEEKPKSALLPVLGIGAAAAALFAAS